MSLHEFGKKVINESINLNLYSCCVVIVLMFSSLIVCITILLTSWMLDYHDIGIMKIMGFGKEISKLIIIENSLVVFFSAVVAYFAEVIRKRIVSMYEVVVFFTCFMLYELFVFIASIAIGKRIKRKKVLHLVNGEK